MRRSNLNTAGLQRFVCIAAFLAAMIVPAPGLQAQEHPAPAATAYDIPAQALDRALSDYIGLSGAQVLYETAIAAGRRSNGVKGEFSPQAALATLLAGTGLVALRIDIDAFVIHPAPANTVDPLAAGSGPDVRFLSALQAGVLKALCGDPRTRPGGYKVGLELWIASNGTIHHSTLFGSTGDAARDALLSDTLRGKTISIGPPSNLPQPIILTIAPRSRHQTGDCSR